MKLKNLLVPLLISGLFVVPSHATQQQDALSWSHSDDGSAIVKYSSDDEDEIKFFEVEISHSKSGEQRLYLFDYSYLGDNTCTDISSVPETITMTFDGQAIKMLQWCKEYSNSSNYYLSHTPETDIGHAYLVNLFKTAVLPIKLRYSGEVLQLPVIGFTKAWNSSGGDAI